MHIISNRYAYILEDKKTDRASSFKKEKAWEAIEVEFNASSSSTTYRNSQCLRKCYENRKKELRKTLADERREAMLTGGGPPPKICKNEETDDILMSILNKKTLEGLTNRFDDDGDACSIDIKELNNDTVMYIADNEALDNGTMTTSTSDVHEPVIHYPSTVLTSQDLNLPSIATSKPLQSDLEQNLNKMNKTPQSTSRRRPATIVKPLASSDIAKKYDILMDKRLQLLDIQMKHAEAVQALTIRNLQLQNEILEIELRSKK